MKEEARFTGVICETRDVAQARIARPRVIQEMPWEGKVILFYHDNPYTSVCPRGRELRLLLKSEDAGDIVSIGEFEPRGGPPADETRDEMPLKVEEVDLGETDEVEAPVTATKEPSNASATVSGEGQEGVEVGK